MMDTMHKIDLNHLDKSNWKTYRFDEIAKSISERIDPNNTDLEVYIGLEHIDPESIHIKRMGTRDDVNGQKLRCYPGDVIFGRRRAYQRKAAIATFDGFCSAHSLVLRANPEVIDPKLFPFFMHSNAFMHRAIDISVGSLSPTINWGTLKHQEFLLPPKGQQAQLAELLWAADGVVTKNIDVYSDFEIYLFSKLKALYEVHKVGDVSLIDLCTEAPTYGANSPAAEYDHKVRYLRITDIDELGELGSKKVSAEKISSNYYLEEGDFLLARSADPGRSYYYKKSDGLCMYAGYLIRFKLNPLKVLPEYLFFYTKTKKFKTWINQTTRTGTLSNINAKEFSSLKIPYVDVNTQKIILSEILRDYSTLKMAANKVERTKTLQKSIINQVF